MRLQVEIRDLRDPPLLPPRDVVRGVHAAWPGPGLHLNEDEQIALRRDDVQLTAGAGPVGVTDLPTLLDQVISSLGLAEAGDLLPVRIATRWAAAPWSSTLRGSVLRGSVLRGRAAST